jgi:hypothetical protein
VWPVVCGRPLWHFCEVEKRFGVWEVVVKDALYLRRSGHGLWASLSHPAVSDLPSGQFRIEIDLTLPKWLW